MKSRERLSSRLGFILISAGCAVGLGNVWRFPYITGQYGGAAFVLLYLLFLVILGLPIMVMEFSVGRSSQLSAAKSFDALYDYWRMDVKLLFQNGHRFFSWYECRTGWRRIF